MQETIQESSTIIEIRNKSSIFLALIAALLAGTLGVENVSACNVYNVELWIADTQHHAQQKKEDPVFKCQGGTFGWYIEWEAYEPDLDDFKIEVCDETDNELVDDMTAIGYQREAFGTASIPINASVGNHTIRVWIHRVGGAWEESNPRTLKVVGVTNVVWQTYPGNTDLGSCPKNGGKRIFPGKETYEDQHGSDRRKVKVKATLNMAPDASDHIYVHFRCWDVDDPSADSAPIDEDDDDPDPNKHSIDNNGSFNFESGYNNECKLAESSEVITTFIVSMQPGDNYRITATTCYQADDDLTNYKVQTSNFPSSVKRTPMLTTWRKLWIERDSMDDVATTGAEKDFTTSTITSLDASSYDSGSNITTLEVDDLPMYWDEDDYLNGGKLAVGGSEYDILDHTIADETLDVQGDPYGNGVRVNDDCNLYDDDYKGNGVFEIDFPVRTSLTAIDRLMFQKAYIEPENLSSAYEDTVSFDLNFSNIGSLTPDVTGSSNFWTVQVMNAFQPQAGNDEDPDSETGTGGLSLLYLFQDNPDKCAIYHETAREMGLPESHYMAHEIGHTQNIGIPFFHHCSDSDCVMHYSATAYDFCDNHKNDLRERTTW